MTLPGARAKGTLHIIQLMARRRSVVVVRDRNLRFPHAYGNRWRRVA